MIDLSTEFGRRAAGHLERDAVVWLTTVGASGTPAPNPVWFLWDGASSLIVFSRPNADRVRHLQANPQVSLNFAGDGRGGDIVVLVGVAHPDPDAGGAGTRPDYLAKYADLMAALGYTAESFAQQYSLPIRITLTRLRGH